MHSGGALGKARERVGYTVIAVQGRHGKCVWILRLDFALGTERVVGALMISRSKF